MTTKQPIDLNQLFDDAQQSGVIGAQSSRVLTGDLGNVVIAGAAGRAMEEIVATEVTLVTVLLDESSSIGYAGLEKTVVSGYNALLDGFLLTRELDSIMVALWTFNDAPRVVHSYVPVAEAERLTRKKYRPKGGTALYDTWCRALAANLAYAQQLKASGTPCRSVIVLITDGEDTSSGAPVASCVPLTEDLLRSEEYAFGFVGVGDDALFRPIARAMGLPEGAIASSDEATPERLRQMFQLVSRSAIRASQSVVLPASGGLFN